MSTTSRGIPDETELERRLHAIYDAWAWLFYDRLGTDERVGAAEAILRGQLKGTIYEEEVGQLYREQGWDRTANEHN